MKNLQGILDEYQSADIGVRRLILAERNATRFDRPGIRRALNEMINARTNLALERRFIRNCSTKARTSASCCAQTAGMLAILASFL